MYDTCPNRRSEPRLCVRSVLNSDRDLLVDLLGRCTPETLRRRFGGFVRQWPESFLRECLAGEPERHDALVLLTNPCVESRVSGLASAATIAAGENGMVAEISLLVEDAWQGVGAGAMLLDVLLCRAWHRGVRQIVFQVDDEQLWLARWASRHLSAVRSQAGRGTVQVEGRLNSPRLTRGH